MVKQELEDFLTEEEYIKIPSNLPEFTIFYKPENNYANVLNVIDYHEGQYISEDQYEHIKTQIEKLFKEKNIYETHILSIIISSDGEKAKKLCNEDAFCWIINPDNDRLVIYENQISDFYGMKDKMEAWLLNGKETSVEEKEGSVSYLPPKTKIPVITTIFVVLNVVIFLICTFTGDMLYNIGTFGAENILGDGEYYRAITAIFLHWDIDHLFGNMLILYFIGEVVEKQLGALRYGILYLIAGICGNFLSMGYEIYTNTLTQSAGASGAIFGVIGALLFLVIVHKGRLEQITITRLLFMILYSLYSGFVGSNINNAAHIGGFVSGIILAAFLWFLTGRNKVGMKRTR